MLQNKFKTEDLNYPNGSWWWMTAYR